MDCVSGTMEDPLEGEYSIPVIEREIYPATYLLDQWSVRAHTLQFRSTSEYFETVEYELQRSFGVRDRR